MKKKLQVFVSSTYTDLIEERQAAVQAILDAGHIPAGMELFKAGNDSQLNTIYKWIDESDVYMLILGGRYGCVEEKSNTSYTQLEYEYALSKNILVFSVVLSSSFLTDKINSLDLINTMEQKQSQKYLEFKTQVMSRIIREVDDCKDIKLSVHTTLNEFISTYNLCGWVRGDSENEISALLKENSELSKENLSLLKQIQKLEKTNNDQIGQYSFSELAKLMKEKKFTIPDDILAEEATSNEISAYKIFVQNYNVFCTGITNMSGSSKAERFLFFNCAPFFIGFELLEKVKLTGTTAQRIQISKTGKKLYAAIQMENTKNNQLQ